VYRLDPWPAEKQIEDYFSNEYIASENSLEEFGFQSGRDEVLSQVAQYIKARKSGRRILDIGCAGGTFLSRFLRGGTWEAYGVELSKYAAASASRAGISTHVGDIHSASFSESFFDVITILDTFYYFPEPRRELQAIWRILKPEGLLVLELPWANTQIWRNESKVARLLAGKRRSIFRNYHLFLYNPKSISFILARCGFELRGVVPLRGNRQSTGWLNLLYGCFFGFSWLLWRLSARRLVWAPRFLVIASPKKP
jgi:SAM-dependent methyltransferase